MRQGRRRDDGAELGRKRARAESWSARLGLRQRAVGARKGSECRAADRRLCVRRQGRVGKTNKRWSDPRSDRIGRSWGCTVQGLDGERVGSSQDWKPFREICPRNASALAERPQSCDLCSARHGGGRWEERVDSRSSARGAFGLTWPVSTWRTGWLDPAGE